MYVAVDTIEDEMYAMQRKYPRLIYSHVADRFKIYYIRKDLHELGVLYVKSSFGNQISIYNIERTICDIIKSRSRVDIQILNEALRRYVKIKSSDYSLLMEYAKMLNIETVLKNYLEVIL